METERKEYKAASVEEAIENGLKEMNLNEEDAEIEVLSKGGFFKKAVVVIKRKEESQEKENEQEKEKDTNSAGKKYIEDVLRLMKINCKVEQKIKDNQLIFYIKGDDARRIIGYRGETLDALQHLVANVVNKKEKNYERVIVDADFYRRKREQTLTNLAKRLAQKAANSGEEIELEPMTAFERRIIHSALQGSKMASTRSEGEGRERHVIIMPLNKEEREIEYGITDFKKNGPKIKKSFGYKKSRF